MDAVPERAAIWVAAERLTDRAATLDDLRWQRLHLIAAARLRARGASVPERILREEQLAAIGADELDQPGMHHRAGLVRPGLPLIVELHDRPNWPKALTPPRTVELLARGRQRLVAEGFSAPPPAEHAVHLAAHSWGHQPLRRALDLVDVALMAAEAQPGEPEAVAAAWGCARRWRTTARAVDAFLLEGPLRGRCASGRASCVPCGSARRSPGTSSGGPRRSATVRSPRPRARARRRSWTISIRPSA